MGDTLPLRSTDKVKIVKYPPYSVVPKLTYNIFVSKHIDKLVIVCYSQNTKSNEGHF